MLYSATKENQNLGGNTVRRTLNGEITMVARYSRTLTVLTLLALVALIPAQADQEYVIDGTVKAIDAKRKEVTILRDNGKETTVKFDDRTEIRLDGKQSKFDNIKEKQEVRCAYWIDKKIATWFGMYVEIDRPPYRGKR